MIFPWKQGRNSRFSRFGWLAFWLCLCQMIRLNPWMKVGWWDYYMTKKNMRLVKTSHRDIFRIQRGTRFAAYFHIGTSTSQFFEKFSTRMSCRNPFCWELSYIIILDLEKKQLVKIMFPWIPTLIPRPRWEKNVSIKNSIKPYQRTLFSCNRAIRYYRYSGFSGSVGPVGDFLDCYTFTILYQCLAIAEQSDWLQRIDQLDPVGGFIQFKKGTKTAIK